VKKTALMTGILAGLLISSAPAFALGDCRDGHQLACINDPPKDRPKVSAPEIDAAAGAKGLAVLVGVLLLVGEGLRRRR
jgi:hypothetical protein